MSYDSPLSGRNPADPVNLNDARIVEEAMESSAIDTSTPEWTEAMQYVLGHPSAVNGTLAKDLYVQTMLADELVDEFQFDVDTAENIIHDAIAVLSETAEQAVDKGFEGAPVETGEIPTDAPHGEQPPVEGAMAPVVKFRVDFTKELDSEQDIIDDISAMYGGYQRDWDFATPSDWHVDDDGTVSVRILRSKKAAYDPSQEEPRPSVTTISRELSPEDVEDLSAMLDSKLGWAIKEQFEHLVLEGAALDDQNPNALKYIADFLAKRREDGASEVAQEIQAYLAKPASDAVEKEAADPTAPPVQQAPAAPNQSLDDMVQRRIALQKKIEATADQVNALQAALEVAIKDQQAVVEQEEPALMALLEKLPDYKAILDGWEVTLSKREKHSKIKYKAVLDAVEKKATKIAPTIANLIKQLKGMKSYLTPIPESKSVNIERTESLHTEADGGLQGLWNKFKTWVAQVFTPEAQKLDQEFQELQDYQTMAGA